MHFVAHILFAIQLVETGGRLIHPMCYWISSENRDILHYEQVGWNAGPSAYYGKPITDSNVHKVHKDMM